MEKKRQTIDYWVLGAQEDGSGRYWANDMVPHWYDEARFEKQTDGWFAILFVKNGDRHPQASRKNSLVAPTTPKSKAKPKDLQPFPHLTSWSRI